MTERNNKKSTLILGCICFIYSLFSFVAYAQSNIKPAITQPIPVSSLVGFTNYPKSVKSLISKALLLSKENLTYKYGSANPRNQGMDCSGTIYYLLNSQGVKNIPRSANDMFKWAKNNGQFHFVKRNDFNSADFSKLKPGDLLFWSGTYNTREVNSISHVMIYLGRNSNDEPLMFGSSDGRTYQNKQMWGVSVFDFKLPGKNDAAKFIGYSCIPEITCDS